MARGLRGLRKRVCKGVRRFEKTYESSEKKGKVLPKNYSMVESFDKTRKIS